MRLDKGTAETTRIATVVAALVFMLQSAAAFAAPPVQRDIFGNVLCAPGSTQMAGLDNGGGQHPQACCLLSCAAALQTMAGLPPTAQWQVVVREILAGTNPPVEQVVALRERRTPANPRAPPSAA